MEAAQRGKSPLVVLAHDDWALGWSIRDALEGAGYRVQAYPRPVVPFHSIKRGRPDLVVIEQTPAIGGGELPLLDQLQRDPETAVIPIVLYAPDMRDLPAPSALLRVVTKAEPILAILNAVRELLPPSG